MEEERGKRIAEKIRKLVIDFSGCKLTANYNPSSKNWVIERETPEYPVKTQDGKELGTFFMRAELRHIYFDEERRIKWPDDFVDPYPVTVESICLNEDHVQISTLNDVNLKVLSEAYYAISFWDPDLKDREDRMKAARLIPAVIKDIEVFLRILKESLEKYNIKFDFSKVDLEEENGLVFLVVKSQDGSNKLEYLFNRLGDIFLTFPTKGMNDDEIVDNVMRRVEALTEYRRKFRKEWLPSEERRNCYESTFLYPEDPFRKSWFYYELYKVGGKIKVKKTSRRRNPYKFPLEKIEFLKEDFPELWEK